MELQFVHFNNVYADLGAALLSEKSNAILVAAQLFSVDDTYVGPAFIHNPMLYAWRRISYKIKPFVSPAVWFCTIFECVYTLNLCIVRISFYL